MTDASRPMATPRTASLAHAALAAGLLANAAGQSLLFVLLPPLGRRLGFSDIQTGALLSLSALLLIVAAPAWGYASERVGRRPVLLLALGAAALAPSAFAGIVLGRLDGAMTALFALVAFGLVRASQALVGGGLMPVAQAYMADTTDPSARAGGMGLVGAAYGIGAIVGAGLAWRLGGTAPAAAFLAVAGLAALGLVAVAVAAPESRRQAPVGRGKEQRVRLVALWPFLLVTFLAITAYGVLQQVTALRLQDAWGLSPEAATSGAGGIMMTTALVMIAVQGLVLRILPWPPQRLLRTGAVVATLALVLATLARDRWELMGAMALFGGAIGAMLPGNLACLSLKAGPHAQGRVAGLNAMGQGLGMSLGPLLGASLHQVSPSWPFASASVLLALAAAAAVLAGRTPATAPEA